MVLIVKLFSIAIIVYGCLLILRPGILKKSFGYLKEGKRPYIASGIKIVVGILFIIASSYCSIPWIVLFLGALAAFSGIAAFLVKKSLIDQLMDWAEKRPVRHVYVAGGIVLFFGVLLALAV
jgi:heme O synthase-like polyprenyltransferase